MPHIIAPDVEAAHWGMGYCHAIDRGLQMCVLRLLGQGRIAECLDGSPTSVEVDRFFRRMNWSGRTSEQIDELSPETGALLDAYCAGTNAGLTRRRPMEFRLLRYRPEPWSREHVLLMFRLLGYVSLAEGQAEVERFFVELVQAGIDDERLESLFPGCLGGLDRSLLEQVTLTDRVVPEAVPTGGATPTMLASNNWVVAPSRSKTGHALFANDPHFEVNRLPTALTELVIELPADTVMAATVPGLPFLLAGRKRDLTWGITYGYLDAIDSWVEQCRDGKYLRGDSYVPFASRRERIMVRNGDPVDVVFHENEHGVLDGDPYIEGSYLSTRWAPATGGAASLNASAEMWKAPTAEAMQPVVGRVEIPLNWVIADSAGHIAYQMAGLCPLRNASVSGLVPMPGYDAAWDWHGFRPPDELPRSFDPPEGFIVTANNDLNHLGVADPINVCMGDYRARRIAQVLARGPCDVDSLKQLQMDTYSIQAEELLKAVRPHLPDGEVTPQLDRWDFSYDTDSQGAVLFEAFYDELMVELFGLGGLGEDRMRYLLKHTGVFATLYANFDRVIVEDPSAWLQGRSLRTVCQNAVQRVPTQRRTWGEVNRATIEHVLLGGRLPRWLGFDRGPIPIPGGRATPHQGQLFETGGRKTSFVPVIRLVADLGEDVLYTSLAGGPSERRFSRWYVSDVARWRAGEYKTLARLDPASDWRTGLRRRLRRRHRHGVASRS